MKETGKSNKKAIPIVPGRMIQSRNNSPILNNADLLEFAEAYRRLWEIPQHFQHMAEEIERNPNRFANYFVKALPVAKLRMQLAFGSTVDHFLPRQDVLLRSDYLSGKLTVRQISERIDYPFRHTYDLLKRKELSPYVSIQKVTKYRIDGRFSRGTLNTIRIIPTEKNRESVTLYEELNKQKENDLLRVLLSVLASSGYYEELFPAYFGYLRSLLRAVGPGSLLSLVSSLIPSRYSKIFDAKNYEIGFKRVISSLDDSNVIKTACGAVISEVRRNPMLGLEHLLSEADITKGVH